MSIWSDLMKDNYPVSSVPKNLIYALKSGGKQGKIFDKGFVVPFSLVRQDSSAWVVSGEKINRSGVSAGGTWYVYKKNPSKGVFD
jgi:hypothetical protein